MPAYDAEMSGGGGEFAYTVVLGKSRHQHHSFFDDPVAVFVAIRGAPPVVLREKVVNIAATAV